MKKTKNKEEQENNHKIHKSDKLNKHKIAWTTNQTNSCFKNEHETKTEQNKKYTSNAKQENK